MFPKPNCPQLFHPEAKTLLFSSNKTVCANPALPALIFVFNLTNVGSLILFPSKAICPYALIPHAYISPLLQKAMECPPPQHRALTFLSISLLCILGVFMTGFPGIPHWFWLLSPQT